MSHPKDRVLHPAVLELRKLHNWINSAYPALVFTLIMLSITIIGIVKPESNSSSSSSTDLPLGLLLRVLWNTLKISMAVSLAVLIMAYPLAYFLLRSGTLVRNIGLSIIVGSAWLSVLVRSYAWTIIFSNIDKIDILIFKNVAPVLLFTTTSVVIGMTHVLLPYMTLILWSGMNYIDRRLEFVAMSLGATRTVYFLRVFLPLSLSSVLIGFSTIFLLSLGFFITPLLLGGGNGSSMMLAALIEEQAIEFGNWKEGGEISVLLLCALLVMILFIYLNFTIYLFIKRRYLLK